ncbi:hypothetical protein Tco_1484000 [Tanacetum coccineum]
MGQGGTHSSEACILDSQWEGSRIHTLGMDQSGGGGIERGDGVTIIKRRHHDLSSDDVKDLATASGRGRLKEDLESSMWRRHQDFNAMSSQ